MDRREKIRFLPDENSLAAIYYEHNQLIEEKRGLLYDESANGCSVVMSGNLNFTQGNRILVKAGRLGNMEAEIRWIKEIYERIYLIGIMYVEKI